MNFRSYIIIAAVLAVLFIVQPAFSAGNVTKIITNYTEDLEKDPSTNLYNYAEQSLKIGDYPNAIRYFDQALAGNLTMMKKTDVLLYLYRDKAYVQIQQGNYTGAVSTVDEGLVQYPNDPMLWNNRGYALTLLGKQQDALTSFDKAVSFNRNYTNAYLNKGDLLIEMGRYTDAVAAFTRANETDPFNVAASDGLEAARAGEAKSAGPLMIIAGIVVVILAGIVVWYVKFRKPATLAADEKKKKSKKK